MIHRKVENPALIPVGSRIAYRFQNQIWVATLKRRESGILVIGDGNRELYVSPSDYLYTVILSPDLVEDLPEIRKEVNELFGAHEWLTAQALLLAMEIWTRCEQHYGIDAEGSKSSDVRRTVAFLILKGDKPALDTATDVLGG